MSRFSGLVPAEFLEYMKIGEAISKLPKGQQVYSELKLNDGEWSCKIEDWREGLPDSYICQAYSNDLVSAINTCLEEFNNE